MRQTVKTGFKMKIKEKYIATGSRVKFSLLHANAIKDYFLPGGARF